VLRVITRLNIGGPSIQATRLSRALDAYDFDTLLIHGRLGEGEGDMSYLLSAGQQVQYVDALRRPIAPWSDLRAAVALYGAMRSFRPHVLHTHMAKAGLLGRAAAAVFNVTHPRHRMRVIHTYHGHVLEGYFAGWTTRVFIALERGLAHVTDMLVGVSGRVRDDLLLRYGIGSPDTFTVLPLGLDLDPFAAVDADGRAAARRALEIPQGTRVITTVGRLTAIKNHPLFLEMAQRIAADTPDVLFLIAGGGELEAPLTTEARGRGLADRVRFLGWRRDLATIYAASDLFVLTSLNEGTPVALIEAMSSGVPGVATDVGGVRDVIVDESMGVVVPSEDPEALTRAVRGLLSDAEARARMGAAARTAVLARFRFERLAEDVAALYRRLLSA
jgi:glycosyltransferase involved in cell wall biosynthesis